MDIFKHKKLHGEKGGRVTKKEWQTKGEQAGGQGKN